MPDFRRYPNEGFPYLVTTTVKGRQPLFLKRSACTIFVGSIAYLRQRQGHQIHAYVLMPDHTHLVVTPKEDSSVSRLMHSLKLYTARQVGALSGSRGGIWQARFYERALRTSKDAARALEYVHFNPVRAGLVGKPEDYEWSSYSAWNYGQASELDPLVC